MWPLDDSLVVDDINKFQQLNIIHHTNSLLKALFDYMLLAFMPLTSYIQQVNDSYQLELLTKRQL